MLSRNNFYISTDNKMVIKKMNSVLSTFSAITWIQASRQQRQVLMMLAAAEEIEDYEHGLGEKKKYALGLPLNLK